MKKARKPGKRILVVMSILEILIGVGFIVFMAYLFDQGPVTLFTYQIESDIATYAIYGLGIFRILAGIIGLMFCNKKSLFTVILGILLVAAHCVNFGHGNILGAYGIFATILILFVPIFYLFGAILNYGSNKEKDTK